MHISYGFVGVFRRLNIELGLFAFLFRLMKITDLRLVPGMIGLVAFVGSEAEARLGAAMGTWARVRHREASRSSTLSTKPKRPECDRIIG